jgi:hypothetical protein
MSIQHRPPNKGPFVPYPQLGSALATEAGLVVGAAGAEGVVAGVGAAGGVGDDAAGALVLVVDVAAGACVVLVVDVDDVVETGAEV